MLFPNKEPDHLPPFPKFDLGQLRAGGFVMALGSIPTPANFKFNQKPAQWSPGINLANDLARGLEIALPLWECGGVYLGDYSQNGRHCAIVDAPSWASTDWGPAVYLSGGKYIWLPDYLPPATGTFSIWVAWVGTQEQTTPTGDAPETYGPVLAFSAEGDDFQVSKHVIGLSGSDPNTAKIQYFHEGSTLTLESEVAAGDQVYRHIVVTYDDDGCALWVDGKLEDIASFGAEFRAQAGDPPTISSTYMAIEYDNGECVLSIHVGTQIIPTTDWFDLSANFSTSHGWAVDMCVPTTGGDFWNDDVLRAQDVMGVTCDGNTYIWLNPGGTNYSTSNADFVTYLNYTDSGDWTATEWKIVQYLKNHYTDFSALGTFIENWVGEEEEVCPSLSAIATWIDEQEQEPDPEDCWHAVGCFGGDGNVDGDFEIGETWLVNTGTALTCITIDDTATCDDLISVTPVQQFDSCGECESALLTGGGGLGSGLGGSATCYYWQFLSYDRVLTDGEIRYLTENPTVLFESPAIPLAYSVNASLNEEGSGGVLVGGSADVLVTVSVGGGVLVGGSADVDQNTSGSGGVLVGGSAQVESTYNLEGSGGLLVKQPTFANGYQFRLPITLAAYRDVWRARVPITVTLPVGASPDALKFETADGGELTHVVRFYDETSRRFTALVKVDLTDEEQTIYLYWGAN